MRQHKSYHIKENTFINLLLDSSLKNMLRAIQKIRDWINNISAWNLISHSHETFSFRSLFNGDMLHVYTNLLSSLTFWLLCIVVVVAALIPDFTIKALQALNINCGSIFPGPKLPTTSKTRCTFFEMTRL